MSIADVILVCSQWEAFGRITVEAMLTGKAVIASANGGTTELIKDGENGLLYTYGNYIHCLKRYSICVRIQMKNVASAEPPEVGRGSF